MNERRTKRVKLITARGLTFLIVPLLGLFIAIFSKSQLLLEYIHVLSGGTWTGIDIFMGFVLSLVLRYLTPAARSDFARRLTPMMLFLMPSLATTAITAGIYLAKSLNVFNLSSPLILSAVVVVVVLLVQGIGIFLPTEVLVFIELNKESPDVDRISRLMRRIFRLGGVQGVFQIILIFIMANIATI